MNPYTKRPRAGEIIDTGRYGVCRVQHVHGNGQRLTVTDRLAREWDIDRAVAGWWRRTTSETA